MTHDNTQSDVVEAWDRLTGCANACGFPSIEAAIEHLADIHLASLSTKDSDAVLDEQAAKRIYEHWSFGTWFKGDKPAWVEGGNSEAQALARTFARAAIRKGDNT